MINTYSKTVHWTVLEDIAFYAQRGKTLVFPLRPFSAFLRYSVLRTELLRASAQSNRTSCGVTALRAEVSPTATRALPSTRKGD